MNVNELFTGTQTIVISCSPHITSYLAGEVQSLGYPVHETSFTTVSTQGTFADCMLLNLSLRTANHVFLRISRFHAGDIQQVYDEVKQVDWPTIIPTNGYFSIHSVSNHEQVKNLMFLNMKVKDAIADRFMQQAGQRPDSGAFRNKTVIFFHQKENECSLYLDTTGESLTRHGYRRVALKAPLQESLAAAMISATLWNRHEAPFINPMCGSGTLAIEAALMAIGKSPGLIRTNFGFMHTQGFDSTVWEAMKTSLTEKVLTTCPCEIIASDNAQNALDAARHNARIAGVESFIRFVHCDFKETPVPSGAHGVVMFNPPYGERLGAGDALQPLYGEIGTFLKKKCPGYFGYVFTANPELAKHIGLKPTSKKPFLNGSLECRQLEYELFSGDRKSNVMKKKSNL